LASLMRLR
jgi:hypothetical protein